MPNDVNKLSLIQRLLYVLLFVLFFSIVNTIILESELEEYTFNNNNNLLSRGME